MQPHMQAARRYQAHARPSCHDITSQRKDTLANQNHEEMQKQPITEKGSTKTVAQCKGGRVGGGLHVWTVSIVELLLTITLE